MEKNEDKLVKTWRSSATVMGTAAVSLLVILFFVLALSSVGAAGSGSTAVAGWTPLITDTFESGITGTPLDLNGATNGEYYWATTTYTASTGTASAWATGGGADGAGLAPGTDPYPASAESALTYGPVDLTAYQVAQLSYDYWVKTETATDFLQVRVSTDGLTFDTLLNSYDGDSSGWQSDTLDLTSYAGAAQLWVRFYFSSNSSIEDTGVFIDNILLEAAESTSIYLPIIGFAPTPTPIPIPPAGEFSDDFSTADNNWLIRRHDTDDDGEANKLTIANGQLRVDVNNPEDYVIVSPMAQAPDGNYQLEFSAKFAGQYNKHRYGFVFGGNWNGVDECPNSNFTNCFTNYYWLEIQYRDNNGDPKLEYSLYRIDGHDSDNMPIRVKLEDWSDVYVPHDIDGFIKWELTIHRNGTLYLDVNDVPEDIFYLPDTRYFENPFVGIMVRTRSSGLNTSYFDYFRVEEK